MKYKIEKLGENLYKVVMPWCYIGNGRLIDALLEIQGYGKVVTCVRLCHGWNEFWLVCTSDK